jgi:DNA-binding transcriptional MocR family regulator
MTGWLDEDRARALADGGAISPAGRWFAAGAAACVAHLPRAGRSAAIRGAIGRLTADDPETALHALAAMLRGERDTLTDATQPDCTGGRPYRRKT